MARFLCAGTHDGNVLNGLVPVVKELRKRGHSCTVLLQEGHSAARSYEQHDKVYQELQGVNVQVVSTAPQVPQDIAAVILAMSPVTGQNLEVELAKECDQEFRPKVYAVEEVIGGRNNPGWRSNLDKVDCLFAPLPQKDFQACREVVVGPLALSRWRNVSVPELAASARKKLDIGDEPVLYFFPSPDPVAPRALDLLGTLIASLKSYLPELPNPPVLLLNRHRRETASESRVPGNGEAFRSAMLSVSKATGWKVFDCSPEYGSLPSDDKWSILPEFRPPEFPTYQEMLAVTAGSGVALTFFGTDGLMVGPFLAKEGIVPILWLDRRLGGRVLWQEKQIKRFDLPVICQVENNDALCIALYTALDPRNLVYRNAHCRELQHHFQFPRHEPAVEIANTIERDLDT